jgi:hypothetical protein
VEALLFQGNQLLLAKRPAAAIEQYQQAIQLAFTTKKELVSPRTITALFQNIVQAYLANNDAQASAVWAQRAARYGISVASLAPVNSGGVTLAELKEPEVGVRSLSPGSGGLAAKIFAEHMQALKKAAAETNEAKTLADQVAAKTLYSADGTSGKHDNTKLSDS